MRETKNQTFKLRGIALYPKEEDGKFSVAIKVDEDQIQKLHELFEKANPDLDYADFVPVENEDNYFLVNLKTKFSIPVYDLNQINLAQDEEYPIYHGASVIVTGIIKEYLYKRKRGLTAYLTGAIVIKQGTKQTLDFNTIAEGFEDDLVQF